MARGARCPWQPAFEGDVGDSCARDVDACIDVCINLPAEKVIERRGACLIGDNRTFFNGGFIIRNDYVRMYVVEHRYTRGDLRFFEFYIFFPSTACWSFKSPSSQREIPAAVKGLATPRNGRAPAGVPPTNRSLLALREDGGVVWSSGGAPFAHSVSCLF